VAFLLGRPEPERRPSTLDAAPVAPHTPEVAPVAPPTPEVAAAPPRRRAEEAERRRPRELRPRREAEQRPLPPDELAPDAPDAPAGYGEDAEGRPSFRAVAAAVAASRRTEPARLKAARTAGPRAARKLRPPRASRGRAQLPRKVTGVTMLVVGILILAYGTVALVWQDPLTALQAAGAQNRASAEFDRMMEDFRRSAPAQTRMARRTAQVRVRRAIARRAAALNLNTPLGHAVGRISIPTIGVRFTVVQGTDEPSLEKGPAHYVETPLPGAAGHWTVGIAGHRTTYLAPFRHIDELRPGDAVVLQMPYAQFRYSVSGTRIVGATDRTALAADSAITGRRRYNQLALTACHPPFSAVQRIIVYATLRSVTPVPALS
jgi:sortase A